ncbi:MAG: AAA family ATPase [Actinobacteria bacterium]|nr:AAA family ATPase [Actinomycetota bacterium]
MACPGCGAPISEGARFCASCGQPLLSMGDERRVVTVLFADIVGFTMLSERLDPEKVKNLVDRWFERLAADITAFGGRVDKIVGDAIVALFGAPVAHEDDAERAVRAGLRMQQTLAEVTGEAAARIEMRIGVNTGEVLVGAMRAGGATTAMGDVVNLASRLQTTARPGEVLVGPATYKATRHVIAFEPRGLLAARGREQSVEGWVATEALLPPGHRPPRVQAPLVGRDEEVELLERALRSSVGHHRALLALVVGDAGVGKTRLATELAEAARDRHGAVVFEGRCVPYGEANVWWPIAEALRRACGLKPGAPADEALARARERVARVFPPSVPELEAERVAQGLAALMGYDGSQRDMDAAGSRDSSVSSLAAFLEQSAAHQPVVLQLSDLHWADDVVLDVLDTLLDRLGRHPVVLLATARQSIRERWTPTPGRHNQLVVNLDPLDRPAGEELLRSLLGAEPPAEVRDLLLERSGGNPFFLEELVALLGTRTPAEVAAIEPVAGGGDALHGLPDALRGLVAARLDGLDADERAVLTDAAVVGRHGPVYALRKMAESMGRPAAGAVDGLVASLVAKELLEVTGPEWSFRSDLVREVAYRNLTKHDRARRHYGIARWIESHHGDGDWTGADVDRLAYHFGASAEHVAELDAPGLVPSGVTERAVHWLGEAARRADRDGVTAVAEQLYTRALGLVGHDAPDVRLRLLVGRSRARAEGWDLEGGRADADAALALAGTVGQPDQAAEATLRLGDIAHRAGDSELSIALFASAAASFEAVGDLGGRSEALRLLGMEQLFCGDFEAAELSVSQARGLFEQAGSRRGLAWAWQNLAWISFVTGDTDVAEARLERSVAEFRAIGDSVGAGWARGLLGFVKLQQGDPAEAESLAVDVLREADGRRDRWAGAMMRVLLATVRLWSGATDDAVRLGAEAVECFERLPDPYGLSLAVAPYARGLVMSGRVGEGLRVFEAAEPSTPQRRTDPGVQAAHLAALVHLGDADGALALPAARQCDAADSSLSGDLLATVALARLQTGDVDGARAALATIGAPHDGRPYHLCARALVAAAVGDGDGVRRIAERLPGLAATTYLDLAFARIAVALVAARDGDAASATTALAACRAPVDSTGDRVTQALVRLAEVIVRRRLGDPGADAAGAALEDRLDVLGADLAGWSTAFGLATGATPSLA